MRCRNLRMGIAAAGLLAGAGLVGSLSASRDPAAVRLVSAHADSEAKARTITVEFARAQSSRVWFDSNLRMQAKVNGCWLAPQTFLERERHLLLKTNRESIEFTVPRGAEACRLLVEYRVGSSPYCRAYFALQKHGLMSKFPNLCHFVLKLFPNQPTLRHWSPELIIPAQSPVISARSPTSHNEVTAPDAASPVCLRSVVCGRGTGEFCRSGLRFGCHRRGRRPLILARSVAFTHFAHWPRKSGPVQPLNPSRFAAACLMQAILP